MTTQSRTPPPFTKGRVTKTVVINMRKHGHHLDASIKSGMRQSPEKFAFIGDFNAADLHLKEFIQQAGYEVEILPLGATAPNGSEFEVVVNL
jgi:hypothetical protein